MTIASGRRSMLSICAVGCSITEESRVAQRGASRPPCTRAQSKRRDTRARHRLRNVWLVGIVRAYPLTLLSSAPLQNSAPDSFQQISFRLLRAQEINDFAKREFVDRDAFRKLKRSGGPRIACDLSRRLIGPRLIAAMRATFVEAAVPHQRLARVQD